MNAPKLQIGYTLTELMIVVTILGLIAAIAVPAYSSGSDKNLQLAAEEFAAAIRFARTESIRTGQPHGYVFNGANKRIRVFRADTSVNPWDAVYDVYHPIDTRLYDIDLDNHTVASADSLSGSANFNGTCNNAAVIYFDANGSPWCGVPENVLLTGGQIVFASGQNQLTLSLDGITGRVTVR